MMTSHVRFGLATTPEVLSQDRIRELITGEGAIKATIMPKIAQHILDVYNTHNREPRTGSINRYEREMKNGCWRLNGATVVFTDKHRLGDGQNRLIASAKSGVPLTTYVIFGIEDECFDTIDAGKPRDHADVLKLMGAKKPRYMAVAVRWAEWIENGKVKVRPPFIPKETGELYLKHKALDDFISDARSIARANNQSVGMVAAFLYTFERIDGELVGEFARHWAQGTYPPRFSSIGAMQAELAHMRSVGVLGGHLSQTMRAAMIVNSWNSVRLGKRVPIKWDPKKPFPKIM